MRVQADPIDSDQRSVARLNFRDGAFVEIRYPDVLSIKGNFSRPVARWKSPKQHAIGSTKLRDCVITEIGNPDISAVESYSKRLRRRENSEHGAVRPQPRDSIRSEIRNPDVCTVKSEPAGASYNRERSHYRSVAGSQLRYAVGQIRHPEVRPVEGNTRRRVGNGEGAEHNPITGAELY